LTLDEKAREIAHKNARRCSGGQAQGDDSVRWHSEICDRLAADIVEGLRWAYERGYAERDAPVSAILATNDSGD